MSLKLIINKELARKLATFTRNEKKLLTKALDTIESQGQLGEPLFHDLNVWKYRAGNLRVLYRKTSTHFIVLAIEKSLLSSLVKYHRPHQEAE